MIKIKKTTIKDLEKIAEFNLGVFAGMYEHEPYTLKKYQEKLKDKEPIIFVAMDHVQLIGNAIAYERDGNLYIWIMAVDKNYRGQGIGKQFFKLLEKEARGKNFSSLTIKTHNVNKEMFALLIKKGFQVTDFMPSSKDIRFSAMRLKLDLN